MRFSLAQIKSEVDWKSKLCSRVVPILVKEVFLENSEKFNFN